MSGDFDLFDDLPNPPEMCKAKITVNGYVYRCCCDKDHPGAHGVTGIKINHMWYDGFTWEYDSKGRVKIDLPVHVAIAITDPNYTLAER